MLENILLHVLDDIRVFMDAVQICPVERRI
jgi:hypothetical protein